MTLTLGIHLGHHSSCAVVSDGVLIGGIQQERVTRKKHDGFDVLTNSLPIHECLEASQVSLDDIDFIVSSFQSVSPGGCGLHQPLIAPNFALFDPFDKRHVVISHHLAHAYCAYGLSGFENSAVVVADLAGSSTISGGDFAISFGDWFRQLSLPAAEPVKTEVLSYYLARSGRLSLAEREFAIPHNAPESFVQSVASLYDNVSEFVFRSPHAHGQLMALAAFASHGSCDQSIARVEDLVSITDEKKIIFKNDWQNRLPWNLQTMQLSGLAATTQEATELILLHYAMRAKELTGMRQLAAAGGVFLNIPANTRIVNQRIFESYFVPSSPHDAGISIGCAFYGDMVLGNNQPNKFCVSSDRVGRQYSESEITEAIAGIRGGFESQKVDLKHIAKDLFEGKIVARFFGRSEFGPRALGGRSLLASPTLGSAKDKLNTIKGRQSWRPVAPLVRESEADKFFNGPVFSPYMNFLHYVRDEYRDCLPALNHPDGSTRAQTLRSDHDPSLDELLLEFGKLSGFPILVNTSLNGAGEPILETPSQAVTFFLKHRQIDAMILGDHYLTRREAKILDKHLSFSMSPGCVILCACLGKTNQFLISKNDYSAVLPEPIAIALLTESCLDNKFFQSKPDFHDVIEELVTNGLLIEECPCSSKQNV